MVGSLISLSRASNKTLLITSAGRITAPVLDGEMEQLKGGWATPVSDDDHGALLAEVLSNKAEEKLDQFDQAQLAFVIRVCRKSTTLSDAGRKLFAATRENRKTTNDADRLRKYFASFDLDWQNVK